MDQLAPEDLVDEWSDLSASSLGPGARLGRYELLVPIAMGGMARVWAARQMGQRGFTKQVVIKTILPHLAHNPEFERMFLDEARIAAGVHHPNVAEIYELGEEGKVLYLAMELVNGDSLIHVLRGGGKVAQPIDPRMASRIVADACAGLHAAHELTDDDGKLLNVVHRDISPHNILVSLEGTVKVTDFGVAKALGQMHSATMAGQVKGKVAYMSPEHIGGTAFDRRADVFAMGCVLYEAVTGTRPFRGEGDPQVMQAVLRGTYDPPSKIVKNFPPELASIIDRAMAPEPRNRFATAERMRVALEEWLAKSGSVVTSTQVGSLVRQRLGPALDKRRDHIKAATVSLQAADAASIKSAAVGTTPSAPQPASRSGVVSTGQQAGLPPPRPRVPSMPGVPPPLRPAAGAPAVTPPLPPVVAVGTPAPPATGAAAMAPPPSSGPAPSAPSAPPSAAKYLVAAVAGVVFALAVGGVALALWLRMRGGAAETTAPAVRPSAVVAATAPAVTALAPKPAPLPSTAPPPAATVTAPEPATSTVDVSSLPPARPTTVWQPPPVAPARPPSAASAAPPPLPANPY